MDNNYRFKCNDEDIQHLLSHIKAVIDSNDISIKDQSEECEEMYRSLDWEFR
jgi:hypothetical protein